MGRIEQLAEREEEAEGQRRLLTGVVLYVAGVDIVAVFHAAQHRG